MLDLLKLITSELLFSLIVPGLFAGVALLIVGKFLPVQLITYKLPATLTGLFLIVLFVYESGRYTEYSANKLADAEQVALIAKLKAQSSEVTVETVTKYVDRIKYVDRWREVVVDDFISKEANAKCIIDDYTASNIRMLINHSNEGKLPSAPIRVDAISRPTSRTTTGSIDTK